MPQDGIDSEGLESDSSGNHSERDEINKLFTIKEKILKKHELDDDSNGEIFEDVQMSARVTH